MSTLHHEEILESIYDEVLSELESKGFGLIFSKEDMHETAAKIANKRFEDLLQ